MYCTKECVRLAATEINLGTRHSEHQVGKNTVPYENQTAAEPALWLTIYIILAWHKIAHARGRQCCGEVT